MQEFNIGEIDSNQELEIKSWVPLNKGQYGIVYPFNENSVIKIINPYKAFEEIKSLKHL